jgi:branched-chain amino acid transport system permease protein
MTREQMRRSLTVGAVAGGATVFLVAIGFIEATARREVLTGLLSLSTVMLAILAVLTGVVAARPTRVAEPAAPATGTLLSGAFAGLVTGVMLGAFAILADAVSLRGVFVNISPASITTITFDFGATTGAVLLAVASAVLGAVGAGLRLLPPLVRGMIVITLLTVVVLSVMEAVFRVMLTQLGLRGAAAFFYRSGALTIPGALVIAAVTATLVWLRRASASPVRPLIERATSRDTRKMSLALYIVAGAGLLILPQVVGPFPSDVLGTAGLYILLGLGLNIVVGYAGLLDLGYVAFFAIGAYSIALFTSPASVLGLEASWWLVLPAVIVIAAIAGLVIGAPVLRLRGDYLAIVTLGFGEIVRLLFLSDWLKPWTGAGQGILTIPPPTVPGLDFPTRAPQDLYYPILLFCILGAIIAYRLAHSRVGRAWNAMREDEMVAEATGINTTNYKLLAFSLGAVFGCAAGALFAVKIGSVFPHSFEILVSITALAVIILGGMGSIPGVIVGALVLVGLPEFLREFDEYRLLVYGAVLVAMMLVRPEGLVPSAMRQRELHESDEPEDQYGAEAGADVARPVVTGGGA